MATLQLGCPEPVNVDTGRIECSSLYPRDTTRGDIGVRPGESRAVAQSRSNIRQERSDREALGRQALATGKAGQSAGATGRAIDSEQPPSFDSRVKDQCALRSPEVTAEDRTTGACSGVLVLAGSGAGPGSCGEGEQRWVT